MSDQKQAPRKINWRNVAFDVALAIIGLWFAISLDTAEGWRGVLAKAGVFVLVFGALMTTVTDTLAPVFDSKRFRYVGVRNGIALMLLGIGLFGAANSLYYQFFAPGGWSDLTANQDAVAGLVAGTGIALLSLALLALLRYRRLARTPWFPLAFDIASALWLVLIAIAASRVDSLVFSGLGLLLGYLGIHIAVRTFRDGDSLVGEVLEALPVRPSIEEQSKVGASAVRWVLTMMPSEEARRELLQELDEAYPPSGRRSRTTRLVVGGVAVWIVVETLSAFISWGLDKALS